MSQTFIGVKQVNPMKQRLDMDEICYEKIVEFVKAGHQVMIFVHARNATVNTAMVMKEKAQQNGETELFTPEECVQLGTAKNAVEKSRNRQLKELFHAGFGIHHAGMLRSDRNLVEKYFGAGHIKVLVCTATLAWGVNLPAHGVIIKGTEVSPQAASLLRNKCLSFTLSRSTTRSEAVLLMSASWTFCRYLVELGGLSLTSPATG